MRIALLGPLEVRGADDAPIVVGGSRLRALLALLALQPGQPVGPDRIVDALWGAEPPAGAANALQSVVSRLRRALAEAAGDRPGIPSTAAGYRLDIPAGSVDTVAFADLVAEGRHRRAGGDPAGAAESLAAALRLWRGPALADVTAPFASSVVTRLHAERLDAVAELAEAYLTVGRPDAAVSLLAEPVAADPLSERFCVLSVRALHRAGRQAEALACYQRTRAALAEELGVDPSAELAAAHLAVLRGAATDAPPVVPATPTRRRTNLRAALSSFIGRDREIDEIRKLLADTRLVTLVGPGGTGKTRLAAEAANGLLDTMPDGVWFVELAPLTDPATIPHAILTALGQRTMLSTRGTTTAAPDRQEQLLDTLADRHALLILDNCEHLVDAVARLVDTLLAGSPEVRILATSRAALSIIGEKLYPVPALELPPATADLATARDTSAVALLVDRAAAVRPGFAVDAANIGAVTAICRRLDGAPLALELAAARLRALTPAQLADRLDDRFRLLTGGNRAALPRHQSLRAVVAWSWELLDEPARVLARRLSVFPGGASLEAAEAICGDEPDGVLPGDAVLDALTSLVDQSLVEAEDRATTRYRMLDTLRAYGAERLAAADETDRIRRVHLHHYRQLAEANDLVLRTRDQESALLWFGTEHDNLLAALRYAVDAGVLDDGLRLGKALVWYWMLTGYAADGGHWLRELVRISPAEPPVGLTGAYAICYVGSQLGDMTEFFGDPAAVRPRAARLSALLARAADEADRNPLLRIVEVFPHLLAPDRSRVREILDRLVRDEDPWVRAAGLLLRGHVLEPLDDKTQAVADAELAVRTFRELGERWGLSTALVGYGEHLVTLGEFRRAAEVLAEAWQVASRFTPETERPAFLIRLAGIRLRAGDVDAAEADLVRANALRAAHPPRGGAGALEWFQADLVTAEVHRRRGRLAAARESFRRIHDFCSQQPQAPAQLYAVALAGLAGVDHDAGDVAAAAAGLRTALETLASSRDAAVLVILLHRQVVLAGTVADHACVATLIGALDALQRYGDAREEQFVAAVDAARAALGTDAFDAAWHRGRGLDFVGIYDYLGVDAGEPSPFARGAEPASTPAGPDTADE